MQGEMVQTKFGIPAVAGRQMEVLSTAVLLATLSPPKPPRKSEWRGLMDQLSKISCEAYRSVRPRLLHSSWNSFCRNMQGIFFAAVCSARAIPKA